MNKITLEQSEWLWALNRRKMNEYYKIRYDDFIELTKEIIGSIISQLFLDCPLLLHIAYKNLYYNWSLNIYDSDLMTTKDYSYSYKTQLDKDLFSYLLFNSLMFSIKRTELSEVIDGDWETYWKKLDKEFGVEAK